MSLYELHHRESTPRSQQPGESFFAFCDRSDRPELEQGRAITNRLLSIYPLEIQRHLICELKAGKTQHISVLFEIALHDLLLQQGFDANLKSREPAVPDICICHVDHMDVHIEATVMLGKDDDTAGLEVEELLHRAARSVQDPFVRIYVREYSQGNCTPSAKDFAKWLNEQPRSEERRVGKECRSRWSPYH